MGTVSENARPEFDGDLRFNFERDRDYGEQREDSFRSLLFEAAGPYWEHKGDKKAIESGRVAVEFATYSYADQKWVPSGLTTTESDWYVFEVGKDTNRRIVVPTDWVRFVVNLARQGEIPRAEIARCGPRGRFMNALIPIEKMFGVGW